MGRRAFIGLRWYLAQDQLQEGKQCCLGSSQLGGLHAAAHSCMHTSSTVISGRALHVSRYHVRFLAEHARSMT